MVPVIMSQEVKSLHYRKAGWISNNKQEEYALMIFYNRPLKAENHLLQLAMAPVLRVQVT